MKYNHLSHSMDFRAFAENAPVSIRSFDKNLNHLYANGACQHLYGKPVDEIIGKSIEQVGLSDAQCRTWRERLLGIFETGRQIQVEDRVVTSKGIRFLQSECVPEKGIGDRVESVLVVSHDITDIKVTDNALRQSEERMRIVIDNCADSIYLKDHASRILMINPACCALVGKPAEQIIGKTDEEICEDPALGRAIMENDRRIMTSGTTEIVEEIVPGIGGSRTLLSTKTPYRDDTGQVIGLVGVTRDTTERKKAEAALRAMEREYFQLFERSAVGQSQADPATGQLLKVNHAFAVLTGYSQAELCQMTVMDITHPDDRQHDAEVFGPVREGKADQWQIEKRFLRKDGSIIWVNVTGNIIRDDDGAARTIAVIRDITKRRKAEEKLQQLNADLERLVAERTAEAMALASQLRELASELTLTEQRERQSLAKVLHDNIQQMLVAAKLQTSILVNRQQDEDLATSARLVRDLLDKTLSTSRTLTAELSPPILYDGGLGPGIQWLARNFFEKHRLKVDVLFDPSGEPVVEDVRIFLFDAVREILFNVVKHSGVKEARVECSRGKDERVRATVSDSGKGFDLTLWQGVGKTEGFGLFSIQQRIRHMGGELDIDSAPGRGTRITVIGPPRPKLRQERDAVAPPQPPLVAEEFEKTNKIRIILADDHHMMRNGLASLLRLQPDLEIVGEASNGLEAINQARSLRPDVVVMDVSMPVLNGIEATAEIHRGLPEVQVIGLSMHEEGELSHAMSQAGAVAYVTKGGPPEALIEAIRKAANTTSQKKVHRKASALPKQHFRGPVRPA